MENYEKIKEIGKGSYGVVWLVNHKKDRKSFVLKQIDLHKTSERDVQSAKQEAALLKKLKHPNIVAYKDSFEKNRVLYIVMLYCEGGDLYSKIKQQNNKFLEETQVVEWFVQIAMALQYMHERHILHRDLKTQNIFLTKNKIIKVGDLGIARVLSGNNDMATTIIGTPYYMSPELFSNKPYNSKSDVWALGCCVYEMATLKHAFNAKDMNSLVFKIVRGKMPPVPNHYSKDLAILIESMLNADPKKRPSVNKILRDPYIRHNIGLFLERTKATQKKTTDDVSNGRNNGISVHASNESVRSAVSNKNNDYNENKRVQQSPLPQQRYSSPNIHNPIIQQQPSRSSNEQFITPQHQNRPHNYNSNLYKNNNISKDDDELQPVITKSNSEQLINQHKSSTPSRLSSVSSNRDNSDSDTSEYKRTTPKIVQKYNPLRDNSPRRQQQYQHEQEDIYQQQQKQHQIPKPRVRISSVVSDIENDRHIELVDKSNLKNNMFDRNNARNSYSENVNSNNSSSNNNNNNSNPVRSSSSSSSTDSVENKERINNKYTPKIINKPISSNTPPIVASADRSPLQSNLSEENQEEIGKVNLSARERRRLKLRLSQNDKSVESKPPILRKIEKSNSRSTDVSEIDGGRPKSAAYAVSKSYGAHIESAGKELPFKDSLKLIKDGRQQVPIVSKSEDLAKISHSKSVPDVKQNNNRISTPPRALIPAAAKPNTKPTFNVGSSSSSESEEEQEPEKEKARQREKDKKEVANFIELLNTTLNTVCLNKADSEVDEFEENIDDILEEDNEPHKDNNDNDENEENEETIRPERHKHDSYEDNNFKSLGNMTLGTLGTTKRITERINALERDCTNGLGRSLFEQAYLVLERFRDEEIEPKLIQLLGRDRYDDYVGKIWQLKFFKDSEKLSKR